jgi:hypothetical protein
MGLSDSPRVRSKRRTTPFHEPKLSLSLPPVPSCLSFSLSEHGEVMNDGSFGQPTGKFEAKGHTISSTSFEFGTLNGGSIIQLVYGYGQRSQP